ncbi:MAG: hypothetical protein Q9191_007098 [Dirinaria sp. TL-2023a]
MHPTSLLSLGFGLLSLVIALPNYGPSSGFTEEIDFDERTVIPAVPALTPVGNEKGLNFNAWVLNEATNVSAVLPHTPDIEIATGPVSQSTNGTPTITPVSPYKFFDLISFWFGCQGATVESTVDVAVRCTIFVAGFVGTQEIDAATFSFPPASSSPPPLERAPMTLAQLPSTFKRLTKVTIIQSDPNTQALQADSFRVTLYKS